MRAKHVIKTSLKTSKARNAANLKATHAMKTTYKRHTPEMANWKATHAEKNRREGDTCHNN